MPDAKEKLDVLIELLKEIQTELQSLNAVFYRKQAIEGPSRDFVHVPFKGAEIYLLHKAFLDAGGAPHDNFKTLLEKTLPGISNKSQRGFSVDSIYKCSDKVCPESKENVKRLLQRMIRNIDSYD